MKYFLLLFLVSICTISKSNEFPTQPYCSGNANANAYIDNVFEKPKKLEIEVKNKKKWFEKILFVSKTNKKNDNLFKYQKATIRLKY